MTVKTRLGPRAPTEEKPKYPYLGRYTGPGSSFVVLFTRPSAGTVVHLDEPGDLYPCLGEWSSTWSEDAAFTRYKDAVTLEND